MKEMRKNFEKKKPSGSSPWEIKTWLTMSVRLSAY